MDVVGDTSILDTRERNPEVAAEYLDCHGGLLRSDTPELSETVRHFGDRETGRPDRRRLSVIASEDPLCGITDPSWQRMDEAVERGRGRNRVCDCGSLTGQPGQIEVAQPLAEQPWACPRALGGYALGE